MQHLANLTIAVDNTKSIIDNTELDDNTNEQFGQNIYYDDEKTSELEVVQFNLEMRTKDGLKVLMRQLRSCLNTKCWNMILFMKKMELIIIY